MKAKYESTALESWIAVLNNPVPEVLLYSIFHFRILALESEKDTKYYLLPCLGRSTFGSTSHSLLEWGRICFLSSGQRNLLTAEIQLNLFFNPSFFPSPSCGWSIFHNFICSPCPLFASPDSSGWTKACQVLPVTCSLWVSCCYCLTTESWKLHCLYNIRKTGREKANMLQQSLGLHKTFPKFSVLPRGEQVAELC